MLPRRVLFADVGKSIVSVFSAVAAAAQMKRPLVITWGGEIGEGSIAELWDLPQTNDNIVIDTQAGELVSRTPKRSRSIH